MLAGASAATASVSRILVDYERFDSEAEEMAAVGMGVVYESAHDLSPLYEAAIPGSAMAARKAVYRAWTDSVEAEALRILSAHGRLLFVDLHSYAVEALPYELHSDLARPPLCVGVDADDEALGAVLHAVDGHRGVALANEPFRGSYRPLSLLGDGRVSSVMLEIRKDMVDLASGRVDAAVCSAMADVLAAAASSIGIPLPCDG
jgi:N-formylglutamate amidohydrolase